MPGSGLSVKECKPLRIALITLDGSRYGKRLLWQLGSEVQRAALVLIVEDTWKRKWRLLRSVARRIGWRDACLYALEEVASGTLLSGKARDETSYETLAANVVSVASVRSRRVSQLLAEHEIDLVLLGQSGIIPGAVLEVPRIGTLNGHPGILPRYRGIDCSEWAILQDEYEMIGSTLHWVDAGVDTGDIVARLPYRWRGDETLRTLKDRLYADCRWLLVDAVKRLRLGDLPTEPNQGGKQYFKMPRALRREAEQKLARFLTSQGMKNPSDAECSRRTGLEQTGGSHSVRG